ncbi:MAG: SAM-dependent DNA methyltransferase [Nitrospirae bacterium]|nr:SAM-dependent DNA methyltransferase [Candidatus Manganitrophaceae bacterium]
MSPETHSQLANFIWSICNLLRGPYKRNEYRKVILPLTVLRRFDCLLAPTKAEVLKKHAAIKTKPENVVRSLLQKTTGRPFYNLSKLDFSTLLDDFNQLAPNLNSYINKFSKNVRDIMDRFAFDQQIARMAEKNLLYEVIKAFARVDLSPERVDNVQMGYVFEELIRIGAEQANEEAGEHFTPREVIKLMVNLLLSPEKDLRRSHVVKTIFDPACGTGGMLSVAEKYIRDLNSEANPHLFGQDWNDEAWAVCKSDMLIKGEDADNIVLGDSFAKDGFDRDKEGKKRTFDYMLANPPFGVEWKQQAQFIENEHRTLGYEGRFGAGLPRINDGSLLFLQHMLSKMRTLKEGGSRIGIVFNGSPLFTGDAGSGESNIRQWIIENNWLEAVVALPDQLFYNTGISTYIWVLTNRKEKERKGKIQLIDARQFYVKMRKSLGNKRNKIGDKEEGEPDQIGEITRVFGNFRDGETRAFIIDGLQKTLVVSKIFDNADFGFHKITVERPLRLNFQTTEERIARIAEEGGFKNLAASNKKNEKIRLQEIAAGKDRQETILALLRAFGKANGQKLYKDRNAFLTELHEMEREQNVRLASPELKAVLSALSERDETAEICRGRDGKPEPDPELRDTESVPLKENIEAYFKREVLPHVPDAWIDHSKTKVGYEIPLNRHFYRYEPPRPLGQIESEIKTLEDEILDLLKDVTK